MSYEAAKNLIRKNVLEIELLMAYKATEDEKNYAINEIKNKAFSAICKTKEYEDLNNNEIDSFVNTINSTAYESELNIEASVKTSQLINVLIEFRSFTEKIVQQVLEQAKHNAKQYILINIDEAILSIDKYTQVSQECRDHFKNKLKSYQNIANNKIFEAFDNSKIQAVKNKLINKIDGVIDDIDNANRNAAKDIIDDILQKAKDNYIPRLPKDLYSEKLLDSIEQEFVDNHHFTMSIIDDKKSFPDTIDNALNCFIGSVYNIIVNTNNLTEEKKNSSALEKSNKTIYQEHIAKLCKYLSDKDIQEYNNKGDNAYSSYIDAIKNSKTINDVKNENNNFESTLKILEDEAKNLYINKLKDVIFSELSKTVLRAYEDIFNISILEKEIIFRFIDDVNNAHNEGREAIDKVNEEDIIINIKNKTIENILYIVNKAKLEEHRQWVLISLTNEKHQVENTIDSCHNLTKAIRETNENSYKNLLLHNYNNNYDEINKAEDENAINLALNNAKNLLWKIGDNALNQNANFYWAVVFNTNGKSDNIVIDDKYQWNNIIKIDESLNISGYSIDSLYFDQYFVHKVDLSYLIIDDTDYCDLDDCIVTIYVKLIPNSYIVEYYGGEGSTGHMSTQEFIYDNKQNLYKNMFKKTGYEFAGWAKDTFGDVCYKDGENVWKLTDKPNDKVCLFAKWTANKYFVEYCAGEGGTGYMGKQEFKYNVPQKLLPNSFIRQGYKFNGWSLSEKSSFVNYVDLQNVKNLSSVKDDVVKLYAQWVSKTYFIVLVNGQGVDDGYINANYDEVMPSLVDLPQKSGFRFVGYFDIYGNQYYDQLGKGLCVWNKDNNNEKLYARWEACN